MNEDLLYNKSKVNSSEVADKEWKNSDDSLFDDPSEFDEEPLENNTTSVPISGKKNVDSSKSGIGGDDVRSMENVSNDSDIGSALTSVPDQIESPQRRSKRKRTERILYSGPIV